MHQGFKKLFYSLSKSTNIIEKRRASHERLHKQLRVIKASSNLVRKKDLKKEIEKLEKHLVEFLAHKTTARRKKDTISKKEVELNAKIRLVNELLANLGKKVDETKFKRDLEKKQKAKQLLNDLEDRLYDLEAKYYEIKENPKHSEKVLLAIENKISMLKEKIRELKK